MEESDDLCRLDEGWDLLVATQVDRDSVRFLVSHRYSRWFGQGRGFSCSKSEQHPRRKQLDSVVEVMARPGDRKISGVDGNCSFRRKRRQRPVWWWARAGWEGNCSRHCDVDVYVDGTATR